MKTEENFMTYPENSIDNNKRYCYVVEGATDESKLKALGCYFVVKTGGKFIRPDIIAFLKEVHKVREVVIITDPDGPGKDIERRIINAIGPCLYAHANKKEAIYHEKVGIAQMSMESLKELLRPFIHHDLFCDELLSLEIEDFIDLGLVGAGSKEKRMKLVEKYHIPYTSGKNVENALMMLAKGKKDIQEDLEND